jgi:hypothetical protein
MLIYRIEDSEGGGLYRGDNLCKNPINSFSSYRHPMPYNDSLFVANAEAVMEREGYSRRNVSDFIDGDYIFGFATTDQLRNWVHRDDWLFKMDQRGFRLAVFDMPYDDVIVGHSQAVFRRRAAISESYFSLCGFFNIETSDMDDDGE